MQCFFSHQTTRTKWAYAVFKIMSNLCSLRWLKPKPRRVSSINPFGTKILNTAIICTGRISDSNLLLKTEIESGFLILSSR